MRLLSVLPNNLLALWYFSFRDFKQIITLLIVELGCGCLLERLLNQLCDFRGRSRVSLLHFNGLYADGHITGSDTHLVNVRGRGDIYIFS